MKKTDRFKELSTKSADELAKVIHDNRKELFNFRFKKQSGELTATHGIKNARRTIAQVKTVLNASKASKKLGGK